MAVLLESLALDTWERGRPVAFYKVEYAPTWNQVGAFVADLPADARTWELIQLDSNGDLIPFGLVLSWNGVYTAPLLVEDWTFSRVLGDDGGIRETITLAGSDFLALLANRIVYPNPAAGWASQTAGAVTYGPDPAETVIKDIVAANLVNPGDSDRAVPGLTIATDQGRGGTVTYKVATPDPDAETDVSAANVNDSLMDMVRAVDEQSPIGAWIELDSSGLVFDCAPPRDLSEAAVFSPTLGNLPEASLTSGAPTGNAILVQSKVTGVAFTEGSGAGADSPWRRVEQYVDQTSTDVADDVTTATAQAIATGAGRRRISVTVADLPHLRFGSDGDGVQGYRVGDIVTLDLRDGVTYSDIVSRVELVASATGDAYTETVTPTIGTATDDASDQTIDARLSARLRELERRLRGSAT